MSYKKENIRSIGDLISHGGGRILTPIFHGSQFPVKVRVTSEEFEKVRGNRKKMIDLAIKKLNSPL